MPSQVALTLRALGGLTTAEIAAPAPAGRDRRAAHQSGQGAHPRRAHIRTPSERERDERRRGLSTLYHLQRGLHRDIGGQPQPRGADLRSDQVTRQLRASLPDAGEVAGLLALMLPRMRGAPRARGRMDRWSRWPNRTAGCGTAPPSPRASRSSRRRCRSPSPVLISCRRDRGRARRGRDADATDWPQILALYDVSPPGARANGALTGPSPSRWCEVRRRAARTRRRGGGSRPARTSPRRRGAGPSARRAR